MFFTRFLLRLCHEDNFPVGWPVSVDHDAGIFGEEVHCRLVPDHLLRQFDLDGDIAVFRAAVAELAILVGSGCPDGAVFFQGKEVVVASRDFDDAGQGDLPVFRDVPERTFRPVPAPDSTVFFEDQEIILARGDGFDVARCLACGRDGSMLSVRHVRCVLRSAPHCQSSPSEVTAKVWPHGIGYAGDFAAPQGVEVDFQREMPFFRV